MIFAEKTSLHAAGAVFPSVLDTPEVEVELYWEQNFKELPAAVFSAVEAYSGISISRSEVEYGNLPVVVLFPFS
ncbi:hypothetical protein [Nocardiopsis metallicus]|uniref:Uncharacterized protein n=1 Tax=Nocardiopsis metallicus TaxID=179819 RepID=A0A840W212_9ACTN|nr:hypothetical protein [Nocardiopsis metallicus]MBB5490859.1 hypothetical protein [Nocardiopsis metallicus]